MRVDLAHLAPDLELIPGDCYLVGGAVRDLLLGRDPNDFDIACPVDRSNAIAQLFAKQTGGRFVDLGRERFSTLRVVTGTHEYDFTDLQGSLEEDLARRDATINAMAIQLGAIDELIDLFDGRADLHARVLRMVREQNFIDDALRIVKVIRMHATLGFEVETPTLEAMRRNAHLTKNVAAERIDAELDKILTSERAAEGVAMFCDVGLDELLFGTSLRAAVSSLKQIRGHDSLSRWFLFVRVLDDAALERVAKEQRWSVSRLRDLFRMRRLIGDLRAARSENEIAVALHDAGEETARRTIDVLAAAGDHALSAHAAKIVDERGSSLFELAELLSGHEIQKLARVAPGPEIGRLKRRLLEAQVAGEVKTREEAIAFIQRS